MSEASVVRKAIAQAQSTASGHTQMTSRQPYITEPTASKRVCFYKSGDAQFGGLPVVINSRTFKTFEGLLDSLSKRVPLPFGVRTITTPRGHTTVRSLDQLHHGQSYICSDRRTVKPIDLERARRKLPPWYHARPGSGRYLAWYTPKPAQHGIARRNEHAVLLHTPKWIVLFRNGEPEVKHRLMLQRRTPYSFEALLDQISEVMHFPVLKLYTPDGRRVDGLPTLILCSGVLVAAGRESFKKINYYVQKSLPPKWLTTQRFGRRRQITRKKKSSSIRSYPFSSSSEHYIVNQIQNSLPGSMCDFPSNPNGSVEVELEHHLESVAETEMDGEREDDALIPSDDDIEKSFRVNQDGSMTVEMKVRLTIKEEETIHWSTTVSRSSVNNQVKADIVSCPALDASIPSRSNTGAMEVNNSEPENSSYSCPEEGCKVNEPTEINRGAASIELERQLSPFAQGSINSSKATSDGEDDHSYSPMENTGNGKVKHEECMVQHFNHPVPKPRCTVPSEMTTATRLQTSNYRSSEFLQFQDNQRNVQETVLHIYENQTCQVNLSGNIQLGLQSNSSHGSSNGCTESPDSIFPGALSTIKCQSPGKQDVSTMSKPYASTYKASTSSTKTVLVTPVLASSNASKSIHGTTSKRKPVRVIVKKNHLFKSANTDKTQKDYKADILKEIKKIRADILSQKGAMKPRKHFRAKTVPKLLKKRNSGNGSAHLRPQTEQLECVQLETDNPNLLLGENKQNTIQGQADSNTLPKNNLPHASLSKGTMTRKTSEYVELWLQKSELQPVCPVESDSLDTIPKYNTMVKASLFNHKSVDTIQPSTKETFDEKKSHLHSPRTKKASLKDKEHISDHATIRGNQQTSKQSTTNSYDSDNKKPSENIEPSTELIDFQAQKYYTVKMSVRPDMKPVLDQLCNSIRSLRDIIQHKISLRLETPKGIPDFFATLASTFNSPSSLLLAFLSIMTLKDGLSHLNACSQSQTNISSSEALLMLQSLKELALIEDTDHLRISLSDLHKSASAQLLKSWNGFQSLSEKSQKSATSDTTGSESHHMPSSNEEELAIQGLMEHLGVPERVREELATLNHIHKFVISNQMEDTDKLSSSQSEVKMTELHPKEKIANFSNFVLEDYVNVYVNSVIDRAIDAHIQNSDRVFLTGTLVIPEMDNLVITDRYQKDVRKENFYNIIRNFQENARVDSDICGDMSSSESSFVAEIHRGLVSNGVDEQGLEEERSTGQENKTVKKQHRMEEERPSDTWEDEIQISKSLNTLKKEEDMGKVVSQTAKDRDTKFSESTFRVKQKFSVEENLRQVEENGSYNESLPKERPFNEERNLIVKGAGQDDEAQQICSNEKSSGLWQNEFQSTQTEDLLQNNVQKTDMEIPLPDVHTVAYFDDTESSIEMNEVQRPITHKYSSMESRAYSEEEDVILEEPQCYTIYQESFEEIPEEAIRYDDNEFNYNDESLEEHDESAERILYNTEQIFGKKPLDHLSGTNLETSNITKPTDRLMDSVSSSLAFSYDSKNNALAKDLEVHMQANRVKSIREMFLAKSNAEIHHGQTRLSSPNLSDYQLESSDSKEQQSSASTEILREEKGTCRLAIAKGYVRRTIEQLYGRGPKGSNSDEKRLLSADKVKKKEGLRNTNVSSLSSIHEDHTNTTPDLSYFNPTCSVEGFNDRTHCVSLNARVGPKDAVLIDKGRWLLRDNQTSCPETEDTPKHVKEKDALAKSEQDSGKEDIPYSLFGHSPMKPKNNPSFTEQEEITGCPGKTFTYFHLPNANDSEVQPDGQKADTPKTKTENKVSPLTDSPKCLTDKHRIATVFTPPDIKKTANKVHPLIETTQPVVTQPTKKQVTEVARHSVEPDALEILYMFCGQHCPIL